MANWQTPYVWFMTQFKQHHIFFLPVDYCTIYFFWDEVPWGRTEGPWLQLSVPQLPSLLLFLFQQIFTNYNDADEVKTLNRLLNVCSKGLVRYHSPLLFIFYPACWHFWDQGCRHKSWTKLNTHRKCATDQLMYYSLATCWETSWLTHRVPL